MKLKYIILLFFLFSIFFNFTQTISAIKLTNKDKREIFRQILQKTNFSNALEYVPDGTLFLSTEYIPVGIQNNFPIIKGVKFQFISPEEIGKSSVKVKYFAFGEFKLKRKSVEVAFVETNLPSINGQSFICRKTKGKWKIRVNKFLIGMT
jgi:hypothetical protein